MYYRDVARWRRDLKWNILGSYGIAAVCGLAGVVALIERVWWFILPAMIVGLIALAYGRAKGRTELQAGNIRFTGELDDPVESEDDA